jgi:cytochrome P450
MADQIAYNPFDPSFHADPYPHYRKLLAGAPRRVAIGSPLALVARYADVVAVTRDHASFSSALPQYAVSRGGNPFGGAMTLPFADPPAHTRLRRLVARDFSPRRIARLAPRIIEVTQQLLEENVDGGRLEAMSALANQLPVCGELLILGKSVIRHTQDSETRSARGRNHRRMRSARYGCRYCAGRRGRR